MHPPLGKMAIAMGGYLAGYDGSWSWESEATYPDNVPWVAMRMFCATTGALTVPLAYYTAKGMGMSQGGVIASAIMMMTGEMSQGS